MTPEAPYQGKRAAPSDLLSAPDLCCLEATISGMFPDVTQMGRDEFLDLMSTGETFVLLDVRRAAEYRVSRISGSRRVAPASRAQSVLRDLGPGSAALRIILYCSVGFRSSVLARRLQVAGFEGCANLSGGIFGWVNDGRAALNDLGETSAVHPYSSIWQRFLRAPQVKPDPCSGKLVDRPGSI